MGYLHIDNLYKNQEILEFRRCYALEKIHGTSAHISYKYECVNKDQVEFPLVKEKWEHSLHFFSGGEKHERFVSLFNEEELLEKFKAQGFPCGVTVYGEAYGGKQQGMKDTYGPDLKFIVFDVKIGDCWLSVLKAHKVAEELGLEFVHYEEGPTDIEWLNSQRDADSTQAIRNGVGEGKKREGVVLRPINEYTKNNGGRVICKHKRDEFRETKTKREVSPEKLKVLEEANAIAEEWVTYHRLEHVGQRVSLNMENMGNIIKEMIEDVKRESEGEVVWSKNVEKAIGKATAAMVKKNLQLLLKDK